MLAIVFVVLSHPVPLLLESMNNEGDSTGVIIGAIVIGIVAMLISLWLLLMIVRYYCKTKSKPGKYVYMFNLMNTD